MNRWTTSDEHFGHNNIMTGWGGKQTPRPFASILGNFSIYFAGSVHNSCRAYCRYTG